jgi:hypothetical protein
VIGLGGGKFEYGLNIFFLKIRVVSQNIFRGDSSREEVQQILDSHPHATDAGAPSTLSRIDRDASQEVHGGHLTSMKTWRSMSSISRTRFTRNSPQLVGVVTLFRCAVAAANQARAGSFSKRMTLQATGHRM